jgi:hypothetical protein
LIAAIDQGSALQLVREAITALDDKGWIRLTNEDEPADFQVAVNANSECEIWDATGRPLPNMRPTMRLSSANVPVQVVQRLTHLTKYQNIKLIDNNDPASVLEKQFVIEWVKDSDASGNPQPLVAPGQTPVFNVGESAYLRVRNNSNKVLNVTILDLQPDWGISKIYPADADYEAMDPGTEKYLQTTAVLPDGYGEGTDVLKVFATIGPTSFDWLLLPALDHPDQRHIQRSAGSALEQLFAALTADATQTATGLRTRHAVMAAPSRTDWACAHVEMQTRRPLLGIKHVRDPKFALLQSAFDQITQSARASRSAIPASALSRPTPYDEGDQILTEITNACLAAVDEQSLPAAVLHLRSDRTEPEPTRGILDTLTYCSKTAVSLVTSFWDKVWNGEDAEFEAYKAALTDRFSGCDPRFVAALTQYAQFVINRGQIPYRYWLTFPLVIRSGHPSGQAAQGP